MINDAIGREFRPFDWWGWIMSSLGLYLMYNYLYLKGEWLIGITIFFFAAEYFVRVGLGRVYKKIYYTTLYDKLYIVELDNNITKYVTAKGDEDLDLYITSKFPGSTYTILEETQVLSHQILEKHQ